MKKAYNTYNIKVLRIPPRLPRTRDFRSNVDKDLGVAAARCWQLVRIWETAGKDFVGKDLGVAVSNFNSLFSRAYAYRHTALMRLVLCEVLLCFNLRDLNTLNTTTCATVLPWVQQQDLESCWDYRKIFFFSSSVALYLEAYLSFSFKPGGRDP